MLFVRSFDQPPELSHIDIFQILFSAKSLSLVMGNTSVLHMAGNDIDSHLIKRANSFRVSKV